MLIKKIKVKEEIHDKAKIKEFAKEVGVSRSYASVLFMRGIDTPQKYREFSFGEDGIVDPYKFLDMEKAAKRLFSAVENGEKILIYGDYDADGVTSVSLLYLYLQKMGARVEYYIPSRLTEGYGMNISAIDEAAKNGVELIVSVDTGITAMDEIAHATSLGIDVVVTDHHESRAEIPECTAVVDPRRQEDRDDFCEYAGVGVAMKLISALRGLEISDTERASAEILDEYADIVAIGTVADIMSLTGENRKIVKRGLEKINSGRCRPGITALLEASGKTKGKAINARGIGFIIAPRINAAGRMGSAETALELLISDEPYKCEALAGELCRLNTERQNEETRISSQIINSTNFEDIAKDRVIVIGSEGWHHGVIGIVCSKILEYYKKPVILLGYEDGVAKGSCRSVDGFNIVKAIESCEKYVERFGGHEQAAGLTLKVENVDAFRKAINEYAEALPEDEEYHGQCAEMKLSPREANLPFALELKGLEPFGKDNTEPLFLMENCKIMNVTALSGGKHTKLILKNDGICFEAVMFSQNPFKMGLDMGQTVSVLFTLEVNEFMNKRSVNLNIKEICFEGEYGKWLERDSDREYTMFCKGVGMDGVRELSREDYVKLYASLKHLAGFEGAELSYRTIANYGAPGRTYFEVRTMLDVFRESGLLLAERLDDYGAFISLVKPQKKADIEATKTFKRMKELAQ